MLESGFVRAGELSLHHTRGGGGAPPLLFIHGLGSSGYREWRFNLPVFARARSVFAPDLPGFPLAQQPCGDGAGFRINVHREPRSSSSSRELERRRSARGING